MSLGCRGMLCACTEDSCSLSAGSCMIQGRALDFRKGGETRESANEPWGGGGLGTSPPSGFFPPSMIYSFWAKVMTEAPRQVTALFISAT